MAYLDGDNIFGTAVSMSTADNPRGRQQNAFPGLSGVESLDQGMRGRFTDVTGILYGADQFGLAAAEENFRSYNDGIARVLVDNNGTTWLNVLLESFEPMGRVRIRAGDGLTFRSYKARFYHLT
jgi:hypothetical protein